jgi:hypothetical protein
MASNTIAIIIISPGAFVNYRPPGVYVSVIERYQGQIVRLIGMIDFRDQAMLKINANGSELTPKQEISMELLKPNVNDYPGQHIKLKIDNPKLDFVEAKDLAKQKAKETSTDPALGFAEANETVADPMLLSWYQGKTGESYPNMECGPGDKPAWIVFAESRGGDLTIDVNEGQYIFIFLSL